MGNYSYAQKNKKRKEDGNSKNLHEEIIRYKLKYEVPLYHQIITKQDQRH